ncbi:2'-5' RNA ligase family protein [Arthrobacter sp. UKPF54-2]|uniref:2'-5' RNA ligase family protein n=1 Tax=Arthrobacter sp. UKPF54-2 TaxID=2600159 RepID=UPI0011B16905|nr:2'-5' RNA ligase family protein [Arthrobacter sp. UKPF54-2]QDY89632.1 2'-5' RNA ligase family protein [Arthrobacter sp. UKPF54-2]
MRNLIVVAFLEPVTEGMEFPRDAWPLHITLVKFDVVDDELAGRVAALMDAPVRAALGSTVTVGVEAGFGRGGSVPVSLIDASAPLQGLHEALVGVVEALSGRVATPGYTGAGFRPHVSHRAGKAPRAGENLELDRIALVDMAPDGGHATRRILRLWGPNRE